MKSCDETRERLVDALFGEIEDRDEALLNEHLLGCDECRAEEAELFRMKARLQASFAAVPEPSASLRSRLEAATRQAAVSAEARAGAFTARPRPRGAWDWIRRPVPAYAAVAAILLAVLLVRWGSNSRPDPRSLRPMRIAVQETPRFSAAAAEETGIGVAGWAAKGPHRGRSSLRDSL